MNDERQQILGRVRSALAGLPSRAALPDWDQEWVRLLHAQPSTNHEQRWNEFAIRLRGVNGIAFTELAELVGYLDQHGWSKGYCDPALWPTLQLAFPSKFQVETTFDRTRVDDYDFGITRATAGIAETGTLILSDRDTTTRLGALAPWVHVAVIDPSTIFADLSSALAAMPDDPNIVWVTGPSKTADVEGILIEGVHGPGAQVALRLARLE
ncbi:MAG: hypothetical protein C0518_01845 [Opitutus sp.]|nr:hypothetical protein [Opitutus sp.]